MRVPRTEPSDMTTLRDKKNKMSPPPSKKKKKKKQIKPEGRAREERGKKKDINQGRREFNGKRILVMPTAAEGLVKNSSTM